MALVRDPVLMNRLLDTYGELLSSRQRELFELYWAQDLSLTEVSEETGLSRQGVNDALARAEMSMRRYEHVLGLLARSDALQDALRHIEQVADALAEPSPPQTQAWRDTLQRAVADIRELY